MSDTLISEFELRVKETPDKPALISYDESLNNITLTFKQLWTLGAKCASLLREKGMKRGDNVFITVPLGPEYWVISFGVMMAGGMPVVLKKLSGDGRALEGACRLSNSKFVFTKMGDDDHAWQLVGPYVQTSALTSGDLVTSVEIPHLPDLNTVLLVRRTENGQPGLLDILRARTDEYVDRGLKPTDPCLSTVSLNLEKFWSPKIVEISHRAVVAQSRSWGKEFPNIESLYIPYMWYAISAAPLDTLQGQTRLQPDSWDKLSYLETQIKLCRAGIIKHAFLGPSDMLFVLDNTKENEGPFLEDVVVGGGIITRKAMERFHKFAKNVYVTYVGSEFIYCTIAKVSKDRPFQDFWCGQPLEGIKLRIMDDDGKPAPPGQLGEIELKTDGAFTRYCGEPELTSSAFTKDGWLAIRDEGYVTAGGDLFCFGRKGNVIMRDLVVLPVAILEKPLSEHPSVHEVKLVGIPDPLTGFNTCACVVKIPGSKVTAEDLIAHVAETMSDAGKYLYPVDHVVFFEKSIKDKTKQELVTAACRLLGRRSN